ncbi:MAG: CysB family transcriptional regulator [Rhodanobacter sp. SCN 68-63]|nr:MAG: CysB family transcriptional regulator [Rhodanobacter sp. SCN 68-63]
MTLTQLRYLIAIADSGLNITLAAERVHATQPGLSKQLKQLEEELGFQLFNRKGKSLDAITHAGSKVLERARAILTEVGNIQSVAANLRNEARGTLRIATTHTQARFALPGAIAALNRSYPEVSVHLQPAADAELLGLLESGGVDLAVVSTAGAPPSGVIALPAYRWQRRVVVPKEHPLTALERAPTLAELAAQPLVSYDSSLKPESSLRRAFESAGLQPQIAMTASDADLIKTYVRAGLGVGVLAEMALLATDSADLRILAADQLFAPCTTCTGFAPQLERKAVARHVSTGEAVEWPTAPTWRERAVKVTARPVAVKA